MAAPAAESQTEGSVVTTLNSGGRFPALIVCEHASNHIPEAFAGLGVSKEVASSHAAWDPGARQVSLFLSELLNAPCVLGEVSRLVYDCNRPPSASDAIVERSEIHRIPGNERLAVEDRKQRVSRYYMPFKQAVEDAVKALPAGSVLITIHSFTPVYFGTRREVELGILHDEDSRLADAMLSSLPRHSSHVVRRNEPYGPQDGVTHTLKLHAIANRLPNVMIEIRSDLIASDLQCREMAQLLHKVLLEALTGFELQREQQA